MRRDVKRKLQQATRVGVFRSFLNSLAAPHGVQVNTRHRGENTKTNHTNVSNTENMNNIMAQHHDGPVLAHTILGAGESEKL